MSAPNTLYTMFRDAAVRYRKPDALAAFRDGAWQCISHDELVARVRRMSAGLYALGVDKGDRVAILSESRPEWTMFDLATLGLCGVVVPVYPTLTAAQAAYILENADARVVAVSNQALLDKILGVLPELPGVGFVVAFDDASAPDGSPVVSLRELESLGAGALRLDSELAERLAARGCEDDLATLIYTSGTTGTPKGVILSHRNIRANIEATFEECQIVDASDRALSFLPLSHVLERTGVFAYLHAGVSVYFACSIETIAEDLRSARPTVMISVPRLYEKIYAKIKAKAASEGPVGNAVFRHLMASGMRWARARHAGRWAGPLAELEHVVADTLLFAKWREALGGRMRYLLSGGAPLMPEIAFAFYAAGIRIYEGYGLTETSPVIAFNRPGTYRIGTVGKVLGNLEVEIAPDGEILVRGPSVTAGYYRMPEATAEAFTDDGFFKTGDLGRFDEDGFLRITDRKKDLIKTSGGKYVAPQPIENAIKVSGLFAQALVIGDRRKFVAALLVPNPDALREALAARGLRVDGPLHDDPRVAEACLEIVDELTPDLARYEKVKKVALLPRELTIEDGEMTPTLKVKRRVVEDRYRGLIEKIYGEELEYATAGEGTR